MHVYLRGSRLQHLRLASGLVLFAFAATHFANHAVGLVSLEAMHDVQALRTAVTRSWPVSLLLLAALVTHVGLALHKLAGHRTWRLARWEAVQVGLGLAIPFLLLPHIVNTRLAHVVFGVDDIYLYELFRLWPDSAVLQSLLLLLVWTHGCVGLHFWLRLSPLYRRLAPALLVAALALPVLALAGFAVAGHAAADIMDDPVALATMKARTHWPDAEATLTLASLRDGVRFGFAALLAAVAALIVQRHRRRGAAVRVRYRGGPTVAITPGMTLLEASRAAGMPHAAVCGGRARCSTCRVRIEEGLETLPPSEGAEAVTLAAIGADADIRLACQIRPIASLAVVAVSHPASPSPLEREFGEIADVVAAHGRGLHAGEAEEAGPSGAAALGAWFAKRMPFPVPVLDGPDWVLTGGRVDYVLDRPAAALRYRHRGQPVTLLVLARAGSESFAFRGQRSGYHVLSWDDGRFDYVLIADLPAARLDKLQALWAEAASRPD